MKLSVKSAAEGDSGVKSEPAGPGILGQMLGVNELDVTPLRERRRNTLTFTAIGLLFLVAVGSVNVLQQIDSRLLLQGKMQLLEAALLMLPVWLVAARSQHVRQAESLLVLAGFIIFASNNVIGGWSGDALYWTFAFPYLVFFLQGQRIGWVVGAGFAFIVPWLMYFSSQHWDFWPYQGSECFFYGLAYFFNVLTAAHFNLLRSMFQRRLVEEVEFNTRQARQHLSSLEFNAAHDTATGLLNRAGCIEILRQDMPETGALPFAIACFRFHRVNELACVFGMDKLNQALTELAERLRRGLPAVAWVARLRPDEFAIGMRAVDDSAHLLHCLNAVESLDRDGVLAEFSIQDEFTCGLAICADRARWQPDELLRQAEQALLFAVTHQVRCQIHDAALTEHFLAYNRRYEKLRVAIAEEQLALHYQPQIDLASGRVIGVEALARWKDVDEGMIPPDIFIPIIESTGLLQRFSQWTIRRAFKDVVAWQGAWPGVGVSINLSADALHDELVLRSLAEELAASDADPALVIIELTESVMLRTPEIAIANMQRIVDMGLRLSIDDYGVGFSSLTYVKQLPAHELKVDRLFVCGLPGDSLDQAIVESTIELAHDLGLKVVAEGIEDAATLVMLRNAGCDVGQGWHIAKAMPFESFLTWQR